MDKNVLSNTHGKIFFFCNGDRNQKIRKKKEEKERIKFSINHVISGKFPGFSGIFLIYPRGKSSINPKILPFCPDHNFD